MLKGLQPSVLTTYPSFNMRVTIRHSAVVLIRLERKLPLIIVKSKWISLTPNEITWAQVIENGARSATYKWIKGEEEKAQLRAEKRRALTRFPL